MDNSYRIYITEDMVKKYAKHSGDTNKLHIDRKYATVKGFNGPIVHGMAIVSLVISKLIEEKLLKSIKLSYKIRFTKPVEIIGKKVYIKILCRYLEGNDLEVQVLSRQNICSILRISKTSLSQ